MTETKSLTYIEVDVPFCSLTYGVAPCRARLISANDPVAASSDGTSTNYMKRGAGLTGAADGKTVTFSGWIRKHADVGSGGHVISGTTTLNGSTYRFAVVLSADDCITFFGYNSAGAVILDARSNNIIPVGPWVHVLASFDLNSGSGCQIYVNDVSDVFTPVATFSNQAVDFTVADWGVAALPSGLGKLDVSLADLWLAPGVFLDLSVTANRRKFIDADLNPVSLGATGNTPTGTAPLVFLSGDLAAWHTNKGTGGGFTMTGALTADEFGTGAAKCFNSIKTCQSRDTFDPDDVTLRFAKDTAYLLDTGIDCLPYISDLSFTPATISLGENLGTRATLQVTFTDHPHTDTGEGFDKYRTERDYDPYSQGTFWGKFRARQPFLRGRAIRWITGVVGDDLADMTTRHYFIDSFDGPTPEGKYTLVAKDLLKFADGDRAQAPALSNGFLVADITNSATAATLSPAGIGNAEYEAAGYATIGGNEVVFYTRTGDALVLDRAEYNTVGVAHKAQDRVQRALPFTADDAANIVYDLLTGFAGIDPSYIDVNAWQQETAAYLGSVYTGLVCEPTSVATLCAEIVKQAGLCVWWDDIDQQLRLRVLRGIVTDAATFTPENTLKGSLRLKEQPATQITRCRVYFGQVDPTKPLSNLDNYRSTSEVIDDEAEADYGSVVVETILSRLIPALGRSVADRLAGIRLGRFRDPPRLVSFDTMRYAETDVELAGGYRVESFCVQDATGAQSDIPIQVTRLNPGPDKFSVEAQEMLFSAPAVDLTNRLVTVDADNLNINLRTAHDSLYPPAAAGDTVTCVIYSGVVVGSVSAALPALDIGSWPVGVNIILQLFGTLQGRGGGGGKGGSNPGSGGFPGTLGGPALYTRFPIDLEFPVGSKLWGGGGGGGGGGARLGGGGGGGGGMGKNPGNGNNGGTGPDGDGGFGTAATFSSVGAGGAGGGSSLPGGAGGPGGGPGLVGSNGVTVPGAGGAPGVGGAAGAAIDGDSFVTTTISGGDLRGPTIN